MKRLYAATRKVAAHEQCELCGAPLEPGHEHVLAPGARALRCACQACAVIVPSSGAYLRIPRDRSRIAIPEIGAWMQRLGIPVGVAAVVLREHGAAEVCYPGPAGLAIAPIDDAVWAELSATVPGLVPEVEALVWTRLGAPEVWRVGIDVVFRLVGELRASWEGITGGAAAPAAIARVLGELRA